MQSLSDDIKQAVAKRMFGFAEWVKVLDLPIEDQRRFKEAMEWAEIGLSVALIDQANRLESRARVIRNSEKILSARL